MEKSTKIILGVLAVGLVGYYLYNNVSVKTGCTCNEDKAPVPASTPNSTSARETDFAEAIEYR